jgi:RNA polymerase sigma factor (sigma-70 family)
MLHLQPGRTPREQMMNAKTNPTKTNLAKNINSALLRYQANQTEENLNRLISVATPKLKDYTSATLESYQKHTADVTLSDTGDDMVQDAWIAVVRQIDQYKGLGAVAWLCSIMRGTIVAYYRFSTRAKQVKTVPLGNDVPQSEPMDGLSSVERVQTNADMAGFIQQMLAIEDAPTQELLKLFYIDGLSQQEIGERYNVSENAISCRLQQVRLKLRSKYSKDFANVI